MIKVSVQDKLFAAVVLPLLAVAAYVWLWRADTAGRLDALAAECVRLVSPADFDFEMGRAKRTLAEAEAELAAERQAPAPVTRVKADPRARTAARESAVIAVLRGAGLEVLASDAAEDAARGGILRATGTRPEPVARTYRLDGTYPQLVAALEAFAAREMAVVPERLSLADAGRARWSLTLWL